MVNLRNVISNNGYFHQSPFNELKKLENYHGMYSMCEVIIHKSEQKKKPTKHIINFNYDNGKCVVRCWSVEDQILIWGQKGPMIHG